MDGPALEPQASARTLPDPDPTPLVDPESNPEKAPDFEQLYSDYFEFVWRSARGLGMPEGSVDDVVQDVFIIVHRKLSEFVARSSIRGWLFGITRRVCKDVRRAKTRRGPQVELDAEREVMDAASPEQQVASKRALRIVDSFAATLEGEHRELFFLTLVEGLSTSEAAEILGQNPNTIYSRVRVMRRELASYVSEQSGAADGRS